jgi:uncharacterized protein
MHHHNPIFDPTMGVHLWSVFVLSLAASLHCIGMCGPLVVLAESLRPGKWTPWAQLPMNLGRITTYSLMGVVAGLIGAALERGGVVWGFQGVAALLGGAAMIFFAIVMFGWIRLPWATRISDHALARFTRALASKHPLGGFTIGLSWGLLPCGLVYFALAAAAATASPIMGAVVMAVFGAATLPAMIAMAGFGGLIGVKARQWLPRIAAMSILLLGVLMVLRGASSAGWIGKVFIAPHVPLY